MTDTTTAVLPQEMRNAIDKATLVSFDVFDTLIHRIVFRPTHLFDLLSKRLASSDLAIQHGRLLMELPRARENAEREARARRHEKMACHEITLTDVYDILRETYALDETTAREIMHEELNLEQFAVYPNPVMQSVYRYALGTGKPVVLCSDMYLSQADISTMLDRAGYPPPHTLLVSGELKHSKHAGSMFDLLSNRYDVPTDRIAHFGDNRHADFNVPRKKGIQAHHFDLVEKTVDERLRWPSSADCDDRAVHGLAQGSLRKLLLHDKDCEDFWFDVGAQVFGPLLLGKFIWLLANLAREPVDKVLFFARDGLFCHRLYERYASDFGVHIPSEYVYFSRATLLVPSFTDMNIHRLWHLFSGRKARSVGNHLGRLDINAIEVEREIRACGFASADESVHYSDQRMHDLLSRLYPFILRTAKRRREAVLPYIGQVAEKHRRLAIVDIGWVGNMQGSFSRLLQLLRTDYSIDGYYFGTFHGISANRLPRNRYQGYLVNAGDPHDRYQALVSGGVELMEFALMAPHGTTLGYRMTEGMIMPILEDNPDDRAMQSLSSRVQEGAMRFVETALPVVVATGFEHWVSSAWSDPFFRLVNTPTLQEAETLGELTHSDTATDTLRRLPLAPKLNAKGQAGRRGTAYEQALEQAFWKKGFLVRNP